jgi:hypothetical protein
MHVDTGMHARSDVIVGATYSYSSAAVHTVKSPHSVLDVGVALAVLYCSDVQLRTGVHTASLVSVAGTSSKFPAVQVVTGMQARSDVRVGATDS